MTPPVAPALAAPFPDPIPGVIPFGTVTLFAGAPAAGKTTILADWCKAWRDGTPIHGHATHTPTALAYLSADRSWATNAVIFDRIGYPDIPHYSLIDDSTVSLADLRKPFQSHDTFENILQRLDAKGMLPPGAHLIVDPVTLFVTGDANKMRDVAVSFIGFSRRCKERQINMTLTAHMGKQKADKNQQYTRPQDRIAGSTAFAGFSHTQVYILDPESEERPWHTLGWNPRDTAPEEFKITRGPDGLFIPYTDEHAEDTTAELVLMAFPDPPHEISMADLTAQVKIDYAISRATLARALDRLIQARRVVRMGRGRYRQVRPS